MKIKKYLTLSLVVLSSCTEWLDFTPKDIVVEEKLFSSASGYRNALNGIYKQIASTDLYGKELSWGFLDVLGQSYLSSSSPGYVGSTSAYYKVGNFDYQSNEMKSYIENIWSKSYNSIANCNNIIGQIGKADPILFPSGEIERKLIEGEALALRGFLHLDMLRLFAPALIRDKNEVAIPYVDKYPSYGEPYLTVTAFMDKVIADLELAKKLVQQYDTTGVNKNRLGSKARFSAEGGVAPEDVFYAYRGYRMSYPAVTALLARAYNYYGKHDLANACANEVIDLKMSNSEKLFSFTKKVDVEKDRKMTSDLIFTLSSPKLYNNYLPYTVSGTKSSDVCLVISEFTNLFDDAADYRKSLTLAVKGASYVVCNRNIKPLTDDQAPGPTIEDMLPMIRLSEMYYIKAEYNASMSKWREAAEILDEVRAGRNCTKGNLFSKITNQLTFNKELMNDVKREFMTEGQRFFYYKKLGIKIYSTMPDKLFVLPLPNSESIN